MKINSVEEMTEAIKEVGKFVRSKGGAMMFQFAEPEGGRGVSACSMHSLDEIGFMVTLFVEHFLGEVGAAEKTGELLIQIGKAYDGWNAIKELKDAGDIEIDTDELLKQLKEEMGDDDEG